MRALSLSLSLGLLEILSMAPQLWEDYLVLPYHLINQAEHFAVVGLNLLLRHDTFKKLLIYFRDTCMSGCLHTLTPTPTPFMCVPLSPCIPILHSSWRFINPLLKCIDNLQIKDFHRYYLSKRRKERRCVVFFAPPPCMESSLFIHLPVLLEHLFIHLPMYAPTHLSMSYRILSFCQTLCVLFFRFSFLFFPLKSGTRLLSILVENERMIHGNYKAVQVENIYIFVCDCIILYF